jgi:hypothetical protein
MKDEARLERSSLLLAVDDPEETTTRALSIDPDDSDGSDEDGSDGSDDDGSDDSDDGGDGDQQDS